MAFAFRISRYITFLQTDNSAYNLLNYVAVGTFGDTGIGFKSNNEDSYTVIFRRICA